MGDSVTPDDTPTRTTRTLPPVDERAASRIGARVGRFQILEKLGGGGEGEVYAAYDPQLDRRIALKFLLSRTHGNELEVRRATQRLLREGRALAHVEHPNVVGVLDVGTDDDEVFMAMDYVRGVTLKEWLLANPPGPEQLPRVLALLQQAGQGLAAAHQEGLVHRDIKPSNILVGDDGRVRVVDFGLARSGGEGVRPHEVESSGSDRTLREDDRVTKTGALAGTPAYMAPEQFLGETLTPKTDQYTFCKVAWEAIFGQRPRRSDAALVDGSAVPEPPQGHDHVPARIVAALGKGLALDPAHRHPSMEALLAELQPPRSRGATAGTIVASLLGVGGVVALALALSGAEEPPCTMGREQIDRVWNDEQREAVAVALGEGSLGSETLQRVHTALDAYADAWAAGHQDACEATHLRHEQSDALLADRMSCLEQRRRELEATVTVLAQAQDDLARRAVSVVEGLPAVEDCADLHFVRTESARAPSPEQRAAEMELQGERALSIALRHVGKYAESIEKADAALGRARELELPRVAAQLQLAAASARAKIEDPEAETMLREAFIAAQAVGDDTLAADAAERLSYYVGVRRARYAVGLEWATIADAAASRGAKNPRLVQARVMRTRATIHLRQGELEAAAEAIDRARALFESTEGSASGLTSLLMDEGSLRVDQGRYEEARTAYLRALQLRRERYGDHHPAVSETYHGLGVAELTLGNLEAAQQALERALEIRVEFQGEDAPRVGELALNLGSVLMQRGDDEAALRQLQRARKIFEASYGPEHPLVATTLAATALVQHRLDDDEAAEATYQQAAALQSKLQGAEHPQLGVILSGLGDVQRDRGEHEEALASYDRAQAILTAARGADHPDTVAVGLGRAETLHALGRSEQALQELRATERGLRDALGPEHPNVAAVRQRLAALLRELGREDEAAQPHEKIGSDP